LDERNKDKSGGIIQKISVMQEEFYDKKTPEELGNSREKG